MSGELFGEPSQEQFDALLAADVQAALRAQNSGEATRARLATEYLDLLGLSDAEVRRLAEIRRDDYVEKLQPQTIETIRSDLHELFPGLKDMDRFASRDSDTSPEEALPAFHAALEVFDLVRKGWGVRLLEGSQSAETNGAAKEITYGKDRADFTPTSVITTPFHEGVHALQYQSATEQSAPHRRRALPGNLAFGEGLPVALEQVLSGKVRVPGEKYYMQLGLMMGLHLSEATRTELTFRQVSEIMWRRAAFGISGIDEAKVASLEADSYKSLLRTTRGNARDSRDISYFEGGQKAARFLNETATLPQEIRLARLKWAFSGMFDPTNPEHAEAYGGDPAAEYLSSK